MAGFSQRRDQVESVLRACWVEHPRSLPVVCSFLDLPEFRANSGQRANGVVSSRIDLNGLFIVGGCLIETPGQSQAVGKVPMKTGGTASQADRTAIGHFSRCMVALQRGKQARVFPQFSPLRGCLQRLFQVSARTIHFVRMNTGESHTVQRMRVVRAHGEHLAVTDHRLGHTSRGKMGICARDESVHVCVIVIHCLPVDCRK